MRRKWGLWAPGIIALSVGLLIILTLKDSPEARGFSPVEQTKAPQTASQSTDDIAAHGASERNISLLDNLFQNVLSNPFIWGLAFTYFCVYVVRQVTFERYVISSKHEILKSRGIRVSRHGQYFI